MTNINRKNSRYFTYIEPVLRAPIIKTYGSLIFTIIAMIVFILFALKPTLETIAVLQKDVENQNKILKDLHTKSNNVQTAKANLDRIDQNTRDRIESLVPKTPDLAGLVDLLEKSVPADASISAIQFQPLVIEKPTDRILGAQLTELSFTFNVEGSYQAIQSILNNLNSSSRLISVTNLVLNKIERSEGILVSVTGKAYYLK